MGGVPLMQWREVSEWLNRKAWAERTCSVGCSHRLSCLCNAKRGSSEFNTPLSSKTASPPPHLFLSCQNLFLFLALSPSAFNSLSFTLAYAWWTANRVALQMTALKIWSCFRCCTCCIPRASMSVLKKRQQRWPPVSERCTTLASGYYLVLWAHSWAPFKISFMVFPFHQYGLFCGNHFSKKGELNQGTLCWTTQWCFTSCKSGLRYHLLLHPSTTTPSPESRVCYSHTSLTQNVRKTGILWH